MLTRSDFWMLKTNTSWATIRPNKGFLISKADLVLKSLYASCCLFRRCCNKNVLYTYELFYVETITRYTIEYTHDLHPVRNIRHYSRFTLTAIREIHVTPFKD